MNKENFLFDPKEPKKLLVYKKLTNIAARSTLILAPTIALKLIDETGIREVLNKEIWRLSDIQKQNFNVSQLIATYIKDNSPNEFNSLKLDLHIDDYDFLNIFYKHACFLQMRGNTTSIPYTVNLSGIGTLQYKESEEYQFCNEFINTFTDKKNFKIFFNKGNSGKTHHSFQDNIVIFHDRHLTSLYEDVSFNKGSVVVINEDDFHDLEVGIQNKPQLHFLRYKNDKDLLILLSTFKHDMLFKTAQKSEITAPFYIKDILIQSTHSLKDIKLENLHNFKEIYLVGENGDGKTLFLQSIGIASKNLQKFKWTKSFRDGLEEPNISISFTGGIDQINTYPQNDSPEITSIIGYGVNRNRVEYSTERSGHEGDMSTLFSDTLSLTSIKKWLISQNQKELKEESTPLNIHNFKNISKDICGVDFSFEIEGDDVFFTEKGDKISIEHLSDGAKSALTLLVDLSIRLHRYQPKTKHLKDLYGVLLIDEVDMHLHPKWQMKFISIIRNYFPKIQIIVTTHSPIVLLGASSQSQIFKIQKQKGESFITDEFKETKNHLLNSIVTSPLFDLESSGFKEVKIEKVITGEDYIATKVREQIRKNKIKISDSMGRKELLKLIDKEIEKYAQNQSKK